MKHIYDNIHRRYTCWPTVLVQLINTPEFQRLKKIKQLSACHYVFPGATHTRYEHSLGVGYLASAFVRTLVRNQPTLCLEFPGALQCSKTEQLEAIVLVFQLAGLCHDLGHGSLSHGFDTIVHELNAELPHHEARSVILLRYMVRKYDIPLTDAVVNAACELIHPQRKSEYVLPSWWYQIIANDQDNIDVDKFDYLVRDTTALGMAGSDLDLERFMEYARVCPITGTCVPNNPLKGYCIGYPTKLQFDINQLFLTRHRLHAQVYQHPAVRAIEKMLQEYLFCIRNVLKEDMINFTEDPQRLCKWTDGVFSRDFLELLHVQKKVNTQAYTYAVSLLDRIDHRKLYKLITEVRIPRQLDSGTISPLTLSLNEYTTRIHSKGQELFGTYSWNHDWYVDKVTIGYTLNPVYRVRFYKWSAEDDHAQYVPLQQSSYTFPVYSQDILLRVYSKSTTLPDAAAIDTMCLFATSLSSINKK